MARIISNQKSLEKEIARALDDVLAESGVLVEGTTKAHIRRNLQIDTGHMQASVYTNSPIGNTTYPERMAEAKGRVRAAAAKDPIRIKEKNYRRGPEIVDKRGSVVGVAAHYTIFNEIRDSFLFRALTLTVGTPIENIVRRVGQRRGLQ